LISKAAFVVVPSEWYENNPLTIIESMTLGTPVIGSDIGGIPELINRNITGYLFSPGSINELTEAIKCAINLNTAEYQQMVEATQEYASNNFSKEAHYSRLMEIYKSTIENYS
jgi:glycosyltransferase involved in cell wall biosynthesis